MGLRTSARTWLSGALAVLGAVAAVAGGILLYVHQDLADSGAFAGRAVHAVQAPPVRRIVAREIAVQVAEPALPDVLAARPLVESALRAFLDTGAGAEVIRQAALQVHRLFFVRDRSSVVFALADAGTAVASALRTLSPRLAREIPRTTDATILALQRRSFAATPLRIADDIRTFALVLPALALALLAAALALAPGRRRAIVLATAGTAVAAAAGALALWLARRYVVGHTYGSEELTTRGVRAAVGAVWDAYLGDLLTGLVVAAIAGALFAAGAAGVIPAWSPAAVARRALAYARRPLPPAARTVRGLLVLVAGLVAVFDPGFALSVVMVLAGAVLVFFGAGEALTASEPSRARVHHATDQAPATLRRSRRRGALGATALAATLGVLAIVGGALTGAQETRPAKATTACNGADILCDRRLDEVVFAGTHNSMSAADSPGWLIANQERPVGPQLDAGIRAFKISTHYGERQGALVHTDIEEEGFRLNRVAAKLDPAAREALQRLSLSLTRGGPRGPRDIWLCHTLCELGATRMTDFLDTIRRFLDRHPREVLILFDEDYVSESDLEKVFQRAKLFDRLAELRPGRPLPTLRRLIDTRKNIVVFAQKGTSGNFPWDNDAFPHWIQDTPLGARKPGQFTCAMSRGEPDNPLLMLNNWADVFPPRLTPNIPLVRRDFILDRARDCIAHRGRIPNIVLTDFYNRGDVVGAVDELNGVRPASG